MLIFDENKARIVLDSFIKNRGHYRKMSEELTAKYGPGYSISMISIIMNSYVNEIISEEEKRLIHNIMLINYHNLNDDFSKVDNPYYGLSKEEQQSVIIQLYMNGRTMEQIANALDISKATVSRNVSKIVNNPNLSDIYKNSIKDIIISNKQNNEGNFRKR